MEIKHRDVCRNTEKYYVESKNNPTKKELVTFCSNGRFTSFADVVPFGKNTYKVVIWYD